MAFLPAALPWIMGAAAGASAIGGVAQGNAARAAGEYNAATATNEAGIARGQANEQEGLVRRASREALGRQIGAFGAAGVAGGASTQGAERQSAINQELDALDTRYKGAIVGYGYDAQSKLDLFEGETQQKSAYISAAGTLLKGVAQAYTGG